MSESDTPKQTSLDELERIALEHYEYVSLKAGAWNNQIPKAIKAWYAQKRELAAARVPEWKQHLQVCTSVPSNVFLIRYHDGIIVRWWSNGYWVSENEEDCAIKFVSYEVAKEKMMELPKPLIRKPAPAAPETK